MAMVGASPEELRALAARFDACASRLDGSRGSIGSALRSSGWAGDDSVAFRDNWSHRLAPSLQRALNSLRSQATQLRVQAAQQEQASSSTGAGGPWSDGGAPGGSASGGGGWGAADRSRAVLSGMDIAARWGALGKDLRSLSQEGGWRPKDSWSTLFRSAKPGEKHAVVPGGLNGLKLEGAGLGFLASYAQWSQDRTSPSALVDLFGSGATAAGAAFTFAGRNATLAGGLGTAGGLVSAGADGIDAFDSFSKGNSAAGSYHLAHGAASGVGAFVPPVALCVGAWDLGTTAGTAIGEAPPMQHWYDRVAKTGETRASASGQNIGTRYKGVAGAMNMIYDAVSTR